MWNVNERTNKMILYNLLLINREIHRKKKNNTHLAVACGYNPN